MCIPHAGLPHKVSAVTLAEPWVPLEHEIVAPERSSGVSVVIVEVSGDLEERLKLYTAPVALLVAPSSNPTESDET